MSPIPRALLPSLMLLWCSLVRAEDAVRVYAAASLTNALGELAENWTQAGHPKPVLVFAASSALAKQIENGAPADVFASADNNWMDYLAARGRVQTRTRLALLGNTLVLITPKNRPLDLPMQADTPLATRFEGKLCTGEPGVVPVGIYAKQALQAMGWWDALKGRIVGTDDVRTALAFVERGECALGIVYATDAAISDKVAVAGSFPETSHVPIVYPFAALSDARPEAAAFLAYLASPEARGVFTHYRFTVPAP